MTLVIRWDDHDSHLSALIIPSSWQFFAAKLSWTFVSLAVVFPLTYEINQAFIRREHALDLFAQRQ